MAESTTTTTIGLSHDVTVNGITYHKGPSVTVPKEQAEDLQRIAYEAAESDRKRLESTSETVQVG